MKRNVFFQTYPLASSMLSSHIRFGYDEGIHERKTAWDIVSGSDGELDLSITEVHQLIDEIKLIDNNINLTWEIVEQQTNMPFESAEFTGTWLKYIQALLEYMLNERIKKERGDYD